MPCYDKFNDTLKEFCISENVINQINDGYEVMNSKTPKTTRAAYFKRAVDILEQQVEFDVMRNLMEENGCCKSGSREKAAKAFAKAYKDLSIAQRLPYIKDVPYMGTPEQNEDGTITVHAVSFKEGSSYACACTNYSKVKRDYPVSKNYCLCCAGHFKYHYEIMLGCKLRTVGIESSPLDSNGENPCVIRYEVL